MELSFFDLVDQKKWQVIQDYFADVIGASVRVVDIQGAPLTILSKPHSYCFELISSSPLAFKNCSECLLFSPQPYIKDKLLLEPEYFLDIPSNIHYDRCPFYMHKIIIPIRASEGEVCAYIVVGPFILGKRQTYPEYFQLSKKLDLDNNRLFETLEEVKVFSFQAAKSVFLLFQEVANYMVQDVYKKISKQEKKEMSFREKTKETSFYLGKVLQALFSTISEGMEMDRISIMLLNNKTKILSIMLAKGLTEKVIKETQVKIGEGISGWVAEKKENLFIDESFSNRELLPRLNQPQFDASFILPIKKGKEVIGILNLTAKEKEQFTKEKMTSVVHLVKLVETTLRNLSFEGERLTVS